MTEAGCISVRARIGVAACRFACASSACAAFARSASTSATASRVTSAIALSITSWLVLPKCTKATASALNTPTASFRLLTSGIATLPARPLSRTILATSNSSTLQLPVIECAADSGMRPSAACARASAASKRSIASTKLWSLKAARVSDVERKPSKMLMV